MTEKVDYSAPVSMAEVQGNIVRLEHQLELQTTEYAKLAAAFALADACFDSAFYRAYLAAEGAEGKRKATAMVKADEANKARKIADALHKSCAEKGRNLREALQGWRTLAANTRGAGG